jgi:predicted TIM-barrel fold metal-dependent hydrolase
MARDQDPDGNRLPIKIDPTTNCESYPIPLKEGHKRANAYAMEVATETASFLGMKRRAFMKSAAGAAATLLAFNKVNQAYGQTGASWDMPHDAARDHSLANHLLKKKHFIFDVQTHHFGNDWGNRDRRWLSIFAKKPVQDSDMADPEIQKIVAYYGRPNYMKEVFLDSYTDLAVLTFIPTYDHDMPLTMRDANETRDAVKELKSGKRLLLHGRLVPSLDRDIETMAEVKETWGISAAKAYTQFLNPEKSFWLDDHRVMDRYVSALDKNDIRILCVHKGIPFPEPVATADTYKYSSARDVGGAAKMYPHLSFVIYHSALIPEIDEGPYSDTGPAESTNSLIRSLRKAGIGPGGNVYAEIGASWRYMMKDPNQAAHFIGKLLRYVGEDNVVWGTDSLFFGSPQDQILAFMTFQISPEYQEKYGYPALTEAIRAKIFGLNSARLYKVQPQQVAALADTQADDPLRNIQRAYADQSNPSFQTYGPRTRGQFLRMAREEH